VRVAALVVLAFLLAGCAIGGTKTTTVTDIRTVTTEVGFDQLGSPSSVAYFGTPVSITPAGAKRYLLTMRPEYFLTGVTANAAFGGGSCAPLSCPGVPDDYQVIPAGSKKLSFVLPAKTKGTVLTLQTRAQGGNVQSTNVTAAQLSALVAGGTSPKLYETLDEGIWITAVGDTVTLFAQQYRP